jgi:hypothetical protein
MIFYLVTAEGKKAMDHYVSSWGPVPGSRIRFLLYEELICANALNPGTYIFSDLERLSPPALKLASEVWNALSMAGSQVRLLNDPSRVLCRHDLLEKLFKEGKNCFKAIRADESLTSLHYPVFVREEFQHTGSLTPLLQNQRDLVNGLRMLHVRGYRRSDLLVVEFCDTSDAVGIFRKYSAFMIAGEIIPRHLIFSRHWNLKTPDLDDSHLAREQEDYLRGNPHRSWLMEIFKLSGIEYGRIDYSLLGCKPQIWEINTNPTVRKLTPRLTSALEGIDCPINLKKAIPLKIHPKLVEAVAIEEQRRRKAHLFRKAVDSVMSGRLMKPIKPMIKALFKF